MSQNNNDIGVEEKKTINSPSSTATITGSYNKKSFLSSSLEHKSQSNTNNKDSDLPAPAAIFKNALKVKSLNNTTVMSTEVSPTETSALTPEGSFVHSRTLQSQVQLDQLIRNNASLHKAVSTESADKFTGCFHLKNYDLEELRPGFFDPSFINHTPVRPAHEAEEEEEEDEEDEEDEEEEEEEEEDEEKQQDKGEHEEHESDASTTSSHNASEKKQEKCQSKSCSKSKKCINIGEEFKLFKQYKTQIFKFFVAYFISMVLAVVPKTRSWIGSNNYIWLLPLATLIHHPARAVGLQLEITLWSIFGGALSIGWSALALYIATCSHPALTGYGGLLWLSLCIALVWSCWLGSRFRRTVYFSTTFNIGIIFTHTADFIKHFGKTHQHLSLQDKHWKLLWDFGISYLFGILVSTAVSIIVFPDFGSEPIVDSYVQTLESIEKFLVLYIDPKNVSNLNKLKAAKSNVIETMTFTCTETFREFSNQLKLSKFNEPLLRSIRNSLTDIIAPLRCVPLDLNSVIDQSDLHRMVSDLKNGKLDVEEETESIENDDSEKTALKKTFQKPIFNLIVQMIICLDYNKQMLKSANKENIRVLKNHNSVLKTRIEKIDRVYKDFTRSKFFSKNLLVDTQCVQMFLFIRYLRHASNHVVSLNSTVVEIVEKKHWQVVFPTYPLFKSLKSLPGQCALDQGFGDQLKYADTKIANDDIFDKIYNTYMSKHVYSNTTAKDEEFVKATDRNDFNRKTTTSKARWAFWKIYTAIMCEEMRWAVKVTTVFFFFSLPSWLQFSYHWYQEYQVFTGLILFNVLMNRRSIATWSCVFKRLSCCLLGIFWGWAANQAKHFASPYVIMTFAGILSVLFAHVYFSHKNTKTALSAIIPFTIIALEPLANRSAYAQHAVTTATIWKSTWVTGLSLFICVAMSTIVNWVLWAFSAQTEVRLGSASLIAHIGKSYQFITDRYLYRDVDDEPSALALKYSSISEIRLSQSLFALDDLLKQTKYQPEYLIKFKKEQYKQLIECCRNLIAKLVESRLSAQYFDVFSTDANVDTTRALLSLRRDAVSPVNYAFYLVSNCFESKNKIPPYIPNAILSRKKLFDAVAHFDSLNEDNRSPSLTSSFHDSDTASMSEEQLENFEKLYWQEIHAISFSSAFTGIADGLQKMIEISKQILGEEALY